MFKAGLTPVYLPESLADPKPNQPLNLPRSVSNCTNCSFCLTSALFFFFQVFSGPSVVYDTMQLLWKPLKSDSSSLQRSENRGAQLLGAAAGGGMKGKSQRGGDPQHLCPELQRGERLAWQRLAFS